VARDQTKKSNNPYRLLDLSPLRACAELEVLDIGYSRPRVTDLSPLANCTMLRQLIIRHTNVRDLRPLGACKHLEYLDMEGTLVDDLSPLAECDSLAFLFIQKNTRLAAWSLHPLHACKSLTQVTCSLKNIRGIKTTCEHFIYGRDDGDHAQEVKRYSHPDLPGVEFEVTDDSDSDRDLHVSLIKLNHIVHF
jgi:Leucine-rich repeat (LRR) protein